MPFIGIIAKETDSNFIKNEVIKNSKKNKFEFININEESVTNIKNIKFETVVINEEITNLYNNSKYLERILNKTKYLIINIDSIKNLEFLTEHTGELITYGLDQKATVTISSIENENILICVQNKFKNIKGIDIEEQDINVEISKNNSKKICNSMAIFTILTIYEEILKKI